MKREDPADTVHYESIMKRINGPTINGKPVQLGIHFVPTAFEHWFRGAFADTPEQGAQYIYRCARDGGKDSLVFEYLEATGDKEWTPQTFMKAALLVLERTARITSDPESVEVPRGT